VLGRPSLPIMAVLLALLAVFAAMPGFVGGYEIKFFTRVLVVGIFVLSLDLLIGIAGMVSFGHAAFFALGAYAVYFVTPEFAAANVFVALGAGVGLAAAGALVIGGFAVLTRGFYFIMVTLAAAQMVFSLFHDTRIAGGSDGAYIYVKPVLALGDVTVLDFSDRITFFYVCLVSLLCAYLFFQWLVRTPFGRVLQTIRSNEARAAALGFNVYFYKLTAFVIAGGVAGFAGALFASIDGYVAPELSGWRESGLAIMMVVLGGVGTLFGPILGAIVYAVTEEVLKSASLVGPGVAEHWPLFLGFILIAAVLAAPKGLAGALGFWSRRSRPQGASGAGIVRARRPAGAKSLTVKGLTKRFVGLVAVDSVTLEFEPNRVHAIIGPNGAGKTTFINLLSGAMKPNGGRIVLDGEDITGRPVHAVARRGVGRSFQRTNVIPNFTVRENCLVAAQARRPSPLRFTGGVSAQEEANDVVYALSVVGLPGRADDLASELSHGEQRQLEIAMLIASGARLLLLDEPLAGMGADETERVTALLRDLTSDHTVVLIEHDMDAVFACADTVTVLVEGRLLARGAPDDIRDDPAVREAYLGSHGKGKVAA
jgi:branched-chain amino acid transport system permease protein